MKYLINNHKVHFRFIPLGKTLGFSFPKDTLKKLVASFSDTQTVNRHAGGTKHGNYWEEVDAGKSVA